MGFQNKQLCVFGLMYQAPLHGGSRRPRIGDPHVLAHKMREAMACEVRQTAVGGQGKRAEIDGGYFGGYVKPANRRENRRDRRLRVNQSCKRKVVVVIRERGGRTLPGVFRSEAEALNFIRRQACSGGSSSRGRKLRRGASPFGPDG